jgi:cell division topological specificity factor
MLDKLLGRDKGSAHLAKERLKLVLIHDRTDINPGTLDILKDEIITVISKHIEFDPSQVQVKMTREGRRQSLIAEIPISSTVRRGLRP